jgi:two-component system cell cycle response regulator DivK
VANELILIVEDNEKNRKLARDVLQFKGFRVIETENALEGLKLAREQLPDLILMDFHVPGMNGIEALGHLRADPVTRHIPVIAVTASAMTEDRQKIMKAGFDALQTKPINITEFLQTVQDVLTRAGKNEANNQGKNP